MYTGEWIGSDVWICDHCPNYGDVWFMSQHICKASRGKDVKSKSSGPISFEKICSECNKSIHIYDRTHHLICKEEDRIANQESLKRLLKYHSPQAIENTTNRWSKGGLRARYIADLRRKARNLNKEPDYHSRKAVLEKLEDGQYYWVLYDTRTRQRIGPVEKATPEELTSWDPSAEKKDGELLSAQNYKSILSMLRVYQP